MQDSKKSLLDALAQYENSKEYAHYREQEEVVEDLFSKYPHNKDLKSVLLKVCVLDAFYSTNVRMWGINAMAKHILSLNIDTALQNGDISIVEKIANFTTPKGKNRLYSFASKYCFHHNQKNFVIFDSFTQKSLLHFQKQDKFCTLKFSQKNSQDYNILVKVIDEIKTFYGLDTFSNRQIDHMLWVYGKENLK